MFEQCRSGAVQFTRSDQLRRSRVTNAFNERKTTMKEASKSPLGGFLRLPQVLALIPVSRSSWWEGVRRGIYPKQISLGPRSVGWSRESIDALINSLHQSGGAHV